MIQRKQTLFLIAIVALLVSMMFLPLATSNTAANDSTATAADGSITKVTVVQTTNIELTTWKLSYGGIDQLPLTYLSIILCLTTFTAFITILLFKFRLLQIRLCYVIGVFLVGIIGFEILYFFRLSEVTSAVPDTIFATKYSISAIFPAIALILVIFAYKGIIKDESLVRSLDRIR